MVDPCLIHVGRVPADAPATHVLIIGVGHYDHLPGGGGKPTRYDDGMEQLTSPPVSARAVADWFVSGRYDNPQKPLGTVALLLSDPNSTTYGTGDTAADVLPADSRSTVATIQEWFERCNAHPGNLATLFFCGHGVASGSRVALVLKDYGRLDANPFAGAIDLNHLLVAMETCRATHQVFFFDACRVASGAMLRTDATLGEKPLMPDPARRLSLHEPVQQMTYHATLKGASAYGRPNKVSVFTEALLKGLDGAAAQDDDGEWWTSSIRLLETLTFFTGRSMRSFTDLPQQPESTRQSALRINRVAVDPALATAYIGLDDREFWHAASLSYVSASGAVTTMSGGTLAQSGLDDWEVSLSAGKYKFSVGWPDGMPYAPYEHETWVVPPYRKITLKVRS